MKLLLAEIPKYFSWRKPTFGENENMADCVLYEREVQASHLAGGTSILHSALTPRKEALSLPSLEHCWWVLQQRGF
jgi:hypothetical protein